MDVMTEYHAFSRSPNPRMKDCVKCGLPLHNDIHKLQREVTPGRRLYESYERIFAYRHPVPWHALPTTDERNLWEQLASDFSRVRNA